MVTSSNHGHPLPQTPPRPPHLPFRRISLPTIPKALENRHSIISVTSFDSTPEEKLSSLPTLIKKVEKEQKSRAHPHTQLRLSPRRGSSHQNRRSKDSMVNRALDEKRRKVVSEILETERAYVSGLDLIYTNFLMPLISSLDTPQPLLGRPELTSIFSNFIDIWNLHRSFFTSLTSLLSSTSDPPPLSPILMSHFPYLSLYTPFVTSFPSVLSSLSNAIATNSAFANFIHTQEADPRCGKLGLRDWLLTIVQRCPRYLLLLKDLIGCTDPTDPEHGALTAVHTLLSKITQSLNMSLHTHSQTLSLLSLQRATPNLPFQLITPGRSLVRRGSLFQGQVERSGPNAREFLLFSDCLVWLARAEDSSGPEHRMRRPRLHRGRSKSETELPTPAKAEGSTSAEERWNFKGRAELVDLEVVVSPAGRDESEHTRFDVLSPEISFAVYAASEGERDEWTAAIRSAKSSLLVSLNMMHPNSTLTSSEATTHLRRALQALPHAPDDAPQPRRGRVDHFLPAIWVPDSKTESCMRCGARFGWRRRRHHCRLCGRCVCADCSGKTFFISDASTNDAKPARACNVCYETVFPLLTSPSTLSTFTPPQDETNTSNNSTIGTLSQLPSWQSMPSFSGEGSDRASPSALFKSPPSAFHEPRRPRIGPRPQSQPVINLNMSYTTSASASSVSVDLSSPFTDLAERSPPTLSSPIALQEEDVEGDVTGTAMDSQRPDPKRFSLAALAVHTAPVTARPSTFGEGRSRRFSLLLGGRSSMHKKTQLQVTGQEQDGLDEGVAAGKLSEILGRERVRQT
ncbi:hypothetical protein K439DRAFT_1646365 [Ramaria rubella]|nr:hypothetical protein K439DRAFT_1646365 [Ramaria rubella]